MALQGDLRPPRPARGYPGPSLRALFALAWGAGVSIVAGSTGCSPEPPVNPFATTGSQGTGGGFGGEGGGGVDSELGGPCVEDAQCDDGIGCTSDRCDQDFLRCRFTSDHSVCDNAIYCDGSERCSLKTGCGPGTPPSCSDGNLCTIDQCEEASQSCTQVPRDADQDGDPDAHCGGEDCDDQNPAVNGSAAEICGNLRDDDCDSLTDEPDCVAPQHDTCQTALVAMGPGIYTVDTTGAALDYATSCALPNAVGDVVVAVLVPPGPAIDVTVRARSSLAPVSVAIAGQCGNAGTEIACGGSFIHPQGGLVSKLRARSVGGGASQVALPLYVSTAAGAPVTLDIGFEPASTAPLEETCGTARTIPTDTPVLVEIVDASADLTSACAPALGELVHRFTLSEPRDVDIYGISSDGDGIPNLSLRDANCALAEDEVTCHAGTTAHIYRHSLPAGDHYVSVSSSAPTLVSLNVVTSAPTPPQDDEDCNQVATIAPGITIPVSFVDHQDDASLGCFGNAPDAAYNLALSGPSDVLAVLRTTAQDSASVQIAMDGCGDGSLVACGFGAKSPVRARKRNLPSGAYDVVAESLYALPAQLTAFVRPYSPAVLVPFSDGCADALTISPSGGFYQGNTSNQTADFSAGCDQAGGPPNGAKDQLLRLVLSAQKRVVFDMLGSSYDTLLDIRKGPACPGTEVPLGCTISTSANKAFLDLVLDPGTYYVQIAGVGTASGAWMLDVHVVDP